MKNKIKKIILQLVVVMVAVVGAFANNLSYQNYTALVDRQGYAHLNFMCIPTTIICSTDPAPFICTDGTYLLYDWNGTTCSLFLYKKMN